MMMTWSPGITLDYLEKVAIQQALKFYQGNKTLAARALGCAINTINAKLERYQEEEQDDRARADKELRDRDAFNRRQRGYPAIDNGSEVTAAATLHPAPPCAGLSMESASHVTEEQPVSLPQWKEVQEMLPKPIATSSGKRRGRPPRKANEGTGPSVSNEKQSKAN